MKTIDVSLPQLGLIAGTRGMLGAGLGLLLGELLTKEQRRAVGWTLVGVGVATTIPLLAGVIGDIRAKRKLARHEGNGKMPERQTIAEEL